MKKRLISPPDSLEKRIKLSADNEYAEKILALPEEKKLHRSVFSAIATAACIVLVASCILVVAIFRPFAPADKDKSVTPKKPWYDLPVGDELFETIDYNPYAELVNADYELPQTEKVLFDKADVVVIGFAENTFTDENIGYFNAQYQQVQSFDDAITMRTLRPIKVVECLKGDYKEKDTLTLAARGYCVTDQNGNLDIADEGDGKFIQKQNVKYIFYMHKYGEDLNGEPLYDTVAVIGCNNVDSLDFEGYRHNDITHDIFMTYADKFKKYDRTDEYPTEHTHREPYLMATEELYPTGYLNYCCEAQAYEMADAVAVVTPSGDIKTSQIISLNPQKSADAPDGSWDFKALYELEVIESLKGDLPQNITLLSDNYWFYSKHSVGYQFNYGTDYRFRLIDQGDVYILYLNRAPEHGENVYKMTTVTNRVWVNADKDFGVCNDPDVNMRYIDIFKAYEK